MKSYVFEIQLDFSLDDNNENNRKNVLLFLCKKIVCIIKVTKGMFFPILNIQKVSQKNGRKYMILLYMD